MKREIKRLSVLISVVLVTVMTIYLVNHFMPLPPAVEMKTARRAISSAASLKADTYSKKLYNQARVYYDSAMVNWQRENKKLFLLRDYEKVREFAKLSAVRASAAEENSKNSTSNFSTKLRQKTESLQNLVLEINQLFANYPLTEESRNRISKGKMLLEEAVIAYNKGMYLEANRKISDSEYLLTESFKSITENLKNYFKSYPLWKKWVDLTVNESKKNNEYSIIIDKFSRKCYVYHNGQKKYEFDAELGKNWVGHKRVKGDMATPEGMYRVTKKIDRKRTKYYKALLLDYPNADDTARFRSDITKGTLPPNSRIGELIEIHGSGGKGVNWTEGCVALVDREMDQVFKIARVGTLVTIVGSIEDPDSIGKR